MVGLVASVVGHRARLRRRGRDPGAFRAAGLDLPATGTVFLPRTAIVGLPRRRRRHRGRGAHPGPSRRQGAAGRGDARGGLDGAAGQPAPRAASSAGCWPAGGCCARRSGCSVDGRARPADRRSRRRDCCSWASRPSARCSPAAVGRPRPAVRAAIAACPGRLGRENAMRNPRRTAATAARADGRPGPRGRGQRAGRRRRKRRPATSSTSHMGADFVIASNFFQGHSPSSAKQLREATPAVGVVARGTQRAVQGRRRRRTPVRYGPRDAAGGDEGHRRGGQPRRPRRRRHPGREARPSSRAARSGDAVEVEFGRTGEKSSRSAAPSSATTCSATYLVSIATFDANFVAAAQRRRPSSTSTASAEGAGRRAASRRALEDYPQPHAARPDRAEGRAGEADQPAARPHLRPAGARDPDRLLRHREHARAVGLRADPRDRSAPRGRHVPRQVRQMIRYEAVVIALLGAVLGLAVGLAARHGAGDGARATTASPSSRSLLGCSWSSSCSPALAGVVAAAAARHAARPDQRARRDLALLSGPGPTLDAATSTSPTSGDSACLLPRRPRPTSSTACMPTFDSVEDERLHRKQRLAAAFRLFSQFGFDEGIAGHITARDPELDRPLLGQPVRHALRPHPGVRPDPGQPPGRGRRGRVPGQRRGVRHPRRGARRRGRTSSPPRTRTRSTARAGRRSRRPLDPLTQDACAFYDDHAVFDDYTGVVLDHEEGKRIAHALGGNKAAILRNHGLLTVGHDRRLGRLVVHHDGAHLPGAAARRGRRHADSRSTTSRRPSPRSRSAASSPAGCPSSPSTTASSGSSPTCSTEPWMAGASGLGPPRSSSSAWPSLLRSWPSSSPRSAISAPNDAE